MNLKPIFSFLFFLLFVFTNKAQESVVPLSTTLEQQFVDVFEKSNRYEEYKVIKIYKLKALRENINDSIAKIKENLTVANNTIASQNTKINVLQDRVGVLQSQLSESKGKANGIQIFGSQTKKTTFKTVALSILLILLAIIGFLFFKFKNSNALTKIAQLKQKETEEDFESHRHRTLEREQKIRRKLQDEINKNKS